MIDGNGTHGETISVEKSGPFAARGAPLDDNVHSSPPTRFESPSAPTTVRGSPRERSFVANRSSSGRKLSHTHSTNGGKTFHPKPPDSTPGTNKRVTTRLPTLDSSTIKIKPPGSSDHPSDAAVRTARRLVVGDQAHRTGPVDLRKTVQDVLSIFDGVSAVPPAVGEESGFGTRSVDAYGDNALLEFILRRLPPSVLSPEEQERDREMSEEDYWGEEGEMGDLGVADMVEGRDAEARKEKKAELQRVEDHVRDEGNAGMMKITDGTPELRGDSPSVVRGVLKGDHWKRDVFDLIPTTEFETSKHAPDPRSVTISVRADESKSGAVKSGSNHPKKKRSKIGGKKHSVVGISPSSSTKGSSFTKAGAIFSQPALSEEHSGGEGLDIEEVANGGSDANNDQVFESLESKLRALTESKKKEVRDLQQEKLLFQQEVVALKETLEQMVTEKELLQSELVESEEKVKHAKALADELSAKKSNFVHDQKMLWQVLETICEEIADKKVIVDSLDAEVASLHAEVSTKATELSRIKEECLSEVEHQMSLGKRGLELESQVSFLEEVSIRLSAENDGLAEVSAERTALVNELIDTERELSQTIPRLLLEEEVLRERVAALEKEGETLTLRNQMLKELGELLKLEVRDVNKNFS